MMEAKVVELELSMKKMNEELTNKIDAPSSLDEKAQQLVDSLKAQREQVETNKQGDSKEVG